MGGSTWSADAYKHIKADYSTKSTDQIFTNDGIDPEMDPKGVKFRESRDSDAHPMSLAIMSNLDVTGSMGHIPEFLIKNKLGALMETMHGHNVPDAHVMFAGIGDHLSDSYPLQVGQFEAGTEELNKWLTKICLEGGGGAQDMESYSLAWFFAARHTSIDCFEKRGEKGFLFTIGDEWVNPVLQADKLTNLLGYKVGEDVTAEQCLQEAQRMYHVFHLHIKQTSTGSSKDIMDRWKKMMGEHLIIVDDYNNIAEIMASTVAVVRGANLDHVVSNFDPKTASSVSTAFMHVANGTVATKQKEGVVKL